MAVSLRTHWHKTSGDKKKMRTGLKRKSRDQKCFKLRHKMLHFWFYVQRWQSTRDLTVELNLLRRMEVTAENSATMASGHFYESLCMAHYQELPGPDLQPGCVNLYEETKSKFTSIISYIQGKLNINITSVSSFGTNLSKPNVYLGILMVCHSFTVLGIVPLK